MGDKDDQTITAASQQAQKLLAATFERLKDSTAVAVAEDEARLFFPHGIELIYVKVEAGLTEKTKVSVEVKIAGGKCTKEATVETVAATDSGIPEAEPTPP